MTVNELALELIREAQESSDDTDYVLIVEAWINDAISEIASVSEWKFFQKEFPINTIISTPTYDLPAEALDLKYLRFTDNHETIDYIDPERLVDVGVNINEVSRPTYWWYESADLTIADAPLTIRLAPIPDTTYVLDAPYYFHPDTTGTTGIIPVPRDKLLVIKERVRANFLFEDKDYEGYRLMLQRFASKLQAAISTDRSKHARTLTLQVRDLPSGVNRKLARLDPNHFKN